MDIVKKEEYLFGKEKVFKSLLLLAPPVMLSQLIQALYNVVDSLFLGHYSDSALNALTIIYPFQYIAIALSVGIGVGVNTFMARQYALKEDEKAEHTVMVGVVISLIFWLFFAIMSLICIRFYVSSMAQNEQTINDATNYGLITCIGSPFIFLEAVFARSHQARGNMIQPMIGQIAGAVINIIFDPIFIFVFNMGAIGAAIATVIGQLVAFLVSFFHGYRKSPKLSEYGYYIKNIFFYGYSAMLQQLLMSFYIVVLNLILSKFGENAITVLGLYYKLQSFFFIPLFGLTTCIIPFLSFNVARKNYSRCKEIMKYSWIICGTLMSIGMVCFIFFPKAMVHIFTNNSDVTSLALVAFPIIGSSFLGAIFSLSLPTFFQAIGKGLRSTLLVLTRQVFCLIPIMYAFSFIGVNYTWIAFPIAESFTGLLGLLFYIFQIKSWNKESLSELVDTPTI